MAAFFLLKSFLNTSVTYNPPNITNGSTATTTITVAGAALGDFVIASFSLALNGIRLYPEVTATDTVTVTFINNTGGDVDLASGTLKVKVIK